MKGFEKVLLACGFVAFLAVPISTSVMAQSYNFPWSTTFNFPDIYSGSVSNATNYLFPTLSPGAITSDAQAASSSDYNLNYSGQSGTEYTQVQSAANYPGGAGGNGLRFWVGYDGSGNYNNNHSDPVDLFLGTSGNPGKQYPELWFCWYMRYQSGFQWAPANGPGGVSGGGPNYSKNIYIWSKTMSNPAVILEYANTDNYRMYVQLNRGGTSLYGNSGWQTVQCGGNANLTSDGSWHCFEAHIKADTNGSNGVGELWIDNVQQFSQSNVNFGTPRGWSMIEFNSNVSNPANSGVNYYIDYDDIAISTTGRIGSSAGGGGTTPTPTPPATTGPTVPTNVQATVVSSSQINLTWTASTDSAGVAGYTIYRGGSQVGTATGTSYKNTGLAADTTYMYTVSAQDAAGNQSAQSTPVSATTENAPTRRGR